MSTTPQPAATPTTTRPKFTAEPAALVAALAYVVKGVSLRPSVPIFAGVLIDATDTEVTLTTFDYETLRTARVAGAVVWSPGRALAPCRVMYEMARKLPKGKRPQPAPRVFVTAAAEAITLTAGSAEYALEPMDVADYPTPPIVAAPVGTFDGAALADAVTRVAVAAGRDETLPVLTGMYLQTDGDTVTLDATDRYRLGSADLAWTPTNPKRPATASLIPAQTLAAAAKLFAKAGPVTFTDADQGRIALTWADGAYLFDTRILDGTFPKIRNLYPDTYTTTALIDGPALAAAVDEITPALERTDPARLTFDPSGHVTVTAVANGRVAASRTVPTTWDCTDPLTIVFNPTYLIDGLKATGTARVSMSINTNRKPAVLSPTDADGTPLPGYRHLLMPIRPGDAEVTPTPRAAPPVEAPTADPGADAATWTADDDAAAHEAAAVAPFTSWADAAAAFPTA